MYLLHFSEPLEHARHYVGCTTDVRERMKRHAAGTGANIVAVALARGIRVTLAALGECTVADMRRLEKRVKGWHGPARFCPHCCGEDEPRAFPECIAYPVALLPFPLDITELLECDTKSSTT